MADTGRPGETTPMEGIWMESKAIVIDAALLFLCLIYIGNKILHHEEIPGFLIGFTGTLCGILIKCVYDMRKHR